MLSLEELKKLVETYVYYFIQGVLVNERFCVQNLGNGWFQQMVRKYSHCLLDNDITSCSVTFSLDIRWVVTTYTGRTAKMEIWKYTGPPVNISCDIFSSLWHFLLCNQTTYKIFNTFVVIYILTEIPGNNGCRVVNLILFTEEFFYKIARYNTWCRNMNKMPLRHIQN